MYRVRNMALVAAVAAVMLGLSARADDKKQEKKDAGPPMPKPTKEHGLLKQFEGTWDAVVKEFGAPGQPASTSKGVEVAKVIGGGLWVLSDYKGSMAGMTFEGHGIYGYDPEKKKVIGTWVDSMQTNLSPMEGGFDTSGKVLTLVMEGPGPDGKPIKWQMVTKFVDNDHHTFTMSFPGPDGKYLPMMEISYTRKK